MNAVFPPWPIREFRDRSDGIPESEREDSIFRGAGAFFGRNSNHSGNHPLHDGGLWEERRRAAPIGQPRIHSRTTNRPARPDRSSSRDIAPSAMVQQLREQSARRPFESLCVLPRPARCIRSLRTETSDRACHPGPGSPIRNSGNLSHTFRH